MELSYWAYYEASHYGEVEILMKDKKNLLLLSLIAFIYLFKLAPIFGHIMTDFRSFYFAGAAYFGGGNIYDIGYLRSFAADMGYGDLIIFPYLYPPPLAFYMTQLSHLGARAAAWLWGQLSVISGVLALLASVGLCLSLLGREVVKKRFCLLLLSRLLFLLLPFDNNLMMGQVNLVVLAFIGVAMVQSLVYRRDLLAGLLLAPAILIKVTPAGLLLYFIMIRRFKVIYGVLLGAVVFGVPALATDVPEYDSDIPVVTP